MKIFGLDFTSAPSKRKTITCAKGTIKKGNPLIIKDIETFTNFSGLEEFLNSKGPWVAGFDFPFGLPAAFIHEIKLTPDWESYIHTIQKWKKESFENKIYEFKKKRMKGKKEPCRVTDILAIAKSPLKQINPPLAKMFYEGATRLLNSDVSVIPCRPRKDNRTALETYPAQLARIFAKKYKNEGSKGNHPLFKKARKKIIKGLLSNDTADKLGFSIQINSKLQSLAIEDGKGDILDSLLCTVQSGWAVVIGFQS